QVLLDCQKAWSTKFDGWVVGGDCDKASSVTCDPQGMITDVSIVDENLNGSIPASISNLQSLTNLYIWNSSLSGPIPATIGNLRNLSKV
ncbi:unnamed protein product, partial [Closterium sp. Naga37s-1]